MTEKSRADQYLDDLATGSLSQQAARITDGIYEPMVIKKIGMKIDGHNGDSIFVEFVVLEARKVLVSEPKLLRVGETPGMAEPNPVGSVCGMAGNMSVKKKRDITVNVMMGLFAAMFNWTPEYVASTDPTIVAARTSKLKEAIAGDGTAFAGYPVNVETYRAALREKPTEIHTRTRFRHHPCTLEEIAEMREIVKTKG